MGELRQRERIGKGIYRDQWGIAATVKVGRIQREKRFSSDAGLKEIKNWQGDTRTALRKLAPTTGRGTFAADVSQGPLGGQVAPPPPGGNRAPIARAGADLNVAASKSTGTATFTLDGRASSDPDGDALTYRWEQTSPTPVTLVGSTAVVTLTRGPGTYVFRLTVGDGSLSASDSVTVKVRKR